MKFEIRADLVQEELEISSAITEFIKDEVKPRLKTAIEKKIKGIDKQIEDQVDISLYKVTTECIEDYTKSGKFKDILKKSIAESLKELEKKYDLEFATQIIQQMRNKTGQ